MTSEVMVAILATGVSLMVPLLWAALGELIIERSGIVNIGIEGVMLFGAVSTALMLRVTDSQIFAVLVAVPVGLVCGAILAYVYVFRAVDQIVAGLMFILLATGFTTLLYEQFLRTAVPTGLLERHQIPLLHRIPVAGEAIFTQTYLTYGAIVMTVVVAFLLRSTWLGLGLDAVGERPQAATAAGLNVYALRSIALILGCGLTAIGGAAIVVTQSGTFLPGITHGQGFIALAVVVVAGFRPVRLIAGAALFGVSIALQFHAQNVSWLASIPNQVWLAVPYLATIAVLAIAVSSRTPAALAVPYVRPAKGGALKRALSQIRRS